MSVNFSSSTWSLSGDKEACPGVESYLLLSSTLNSLFDFLFPIFPTVGASEDEKQYVAPTLKWL